MADAKGPPQPSYATDLGFSNITAFMHNMAEAMEVTTGIAKMLAEKQPLSPGKAPDVSTFEQIGKTFADVAQSYLDNPAKLIEAQMQLVKSQAELWHNTWQAALGGEAQAVASPEKGDRRFKDPDWEQNQIFNLLKQTYLITARWSQDLVDQADGMDEHTRHKAQFYMEQLANALSPSNFALTNPEIIKLTVSSNGANLVEGMKNLAEDLKDGFENFRIRQTDLSAFEVGREIAPTPGKVIFQNEVMQLIQYNPAGKKVFKKPLLIIPPWINKYYILDLNKEKSFIGWCVAQGLSVFVISWVNPDEKHAGKSFADYMHQGIFAALENIEKATGESQVSAIGYCVGGTLLAATLAYMAQKGDERITAATLFTTQVDFEKAGDLKVFVDKEQLSNIENTMAKTGYLEGKRMANAFNLLRSNDLIWSYVVSNYLKGKEPAPFDLLYWNADSTRMPAAVHSYYLRECYLNNNMSKGEMVLDGTRLDLSKVTIPIYNLATREDHIAPVASAFRNGKFFGGDTRLVVTGSGHIAGVVNPPEANKYQFWTNDGKSGKTAENIEEWLEEAKETAGSWWPDWFDWLSKSSGEMVPARIPGKGKLKAIEDAPGSYVKVKAG